MHSSSKLLRWVLLLFYRKLDIELLISFCHWIIHSERCCYRYQRVPGNNSDCYVSESSTAVLRCEIFAPHDSNNTSLATLKWYRIIESIVEDISYKYESSMMIATIAVNSSNSPINGLFQHNYKLTIGSINSSDSGIYFCQISADGFCFIPSAYVNITVNTSLNGNGCSSVNYQRSPVCALNNPSSCQVTPTPPFLVNNSTPTVMANIALTSLISPVAIPRIPHHQPTLQCWLVHYHLSLLC